MQNALKEEVLQMMTKNAHINAATLQKLKYTTVIAVDWLKVKQKS